MQPPSLAPDPKATPQVGLSLERQDFSHPWVVSGIVSALSFALGLLVLYCTGRWAKLWQWADMPFMIYFAILMPVLCGFTLFGLYTLVEKFFRKRRR